MTHLVCLPPSLQLPGATIAAKYCSDQDTIALDVSVEHFPVAHLPVSMDAIACPNATIATL
jgi:hypothetical protein